MLKQVLKNKKNTNNNHIPFHLTPSKLHYLRIQELKKIHHKLINVTKTKWVTGNESNWEDFRRNRKPTPKQEVRDRTIDILQRGRMCVKTGDMRT